MISAHMEGISGVTCPEDVRPGPVRWKRARRWLTSDVTVLAMASTETLYG